MEIKTKYKPGDIVWVSAKQPYKTLIVMIMIDEQGIPLYGSGRSPAEGLYQESQLSKNRPIFQLPAEK